MCYNRNKVAVGDGRFTPEETSRFVTIFCQNIRESRARRLGGQGMNTEERWRPPEEVVKVNFDGATFTHDKAVGVGVIARDSEGKVLAWVSRRFMLNGSAEVAETIAARSAVELIRRRRWSRIILEGDCHAVIKEINDPEISFSHVGAIIEDIKSLLNQCEWKTVRHVRREGNRAAHLLARNATSLEKGGEESPGYHHECILSDIAV